MQMNELQVTYCLASIDPMRLRNGAAPFRPTTIAASFGPSQILLGRAGYDVDTVADGEEAWGALQSVRYHLLITDHQMPTSPGAELIRRIRASLGPLPIARPRPPCWKRSMKGAMRCCPSPSRSGN
jgi:hypothetical protein